MSTLRVLLDTNVLIHREAATVVRDDIGGLFKWFDTLHYQKCIHPVSVQEIEKHEDERVVRSFQAKIGNYHVLRTLAPIAPELAQILQEDLSENDRNDTIILNEVYCGRADLLVTEDKKITTKAKRLKIGEKIFTINSFLEKVTSENPDLVDYKVLSVRKEFFGNIDVNSPFFDSFRTDYPGFNRWFNRKADETAYVCLENGQLIAFLYLKLETAEENYSDLVPVFSRGRRLKIGTLKVAANGYRLGERFLKIVFDNAVRTKVDEIYVTLFDSSPDKARLVDLLEDFGFRFHGLKGGTEKVYVRNFVPNADASEPSSTFPYFSLQRGIFLVPIYPAYHTELLPDSILNTESPNSFSESEPHRNAIRKVYICRSLERNLKRGDVIVFYRTGGYYKGVVTTVGIVESVIDGIPDADTFVSLCRKRSVFSDKQLLEHWNYNPRSRPFIVNFLYAYSFPKRPNLQRLIELGIVKDISSVPRGFERITAKQMQSILRESESAPLAVATEKVAQTAL